ncbi:MAG: hypothetical protein CR982_07245 [Candidatus Cloacimonadota bacterium]|nr:MAG: hypothetical protein CR982_07245 [Candidatus Cloacimonadota bacterium]PIE78296.1 MAG: hypothetical protein CSA15_08525 [Candidatus Delongbacteria bacterium]
MLSSQNLNFRESDCEENIDKTYIKIAVIDDDDQVHSVISLALSNFEYKGQPIKIIKGYSEKDAENIFRENDDIHLAIIDIVMEHDDSGLKIIKLIRETLKNKFIRIVISTGQPGVAPEKKVITGYDINDYVSKTNLTSGRLFTLVTTSIRGYKDLIEVEKSRLEIDKRDRLNNKVLNALPCYAMLLDSNGFIINSNSPATLKGVSKGFRCLDFEKCFSCMWGALPSNFNPDKYNEWENEFKSTNYSHYWTPVDENKYLYTVFDITEKKKYQKMLIESKKMESIGLLASGIAHDFNNVLGGIIGFLNLLKVRFSEESEEGELISNIISASKGGIDLSKSLLSLTKKSSNEPSLLNMDDIINQSVKLLKASSKSVVFKTNFNAKSAMVMGDKNLFENMFINLGLNSIDAMEGVGTIEISTHDLSDIKYLKFADMDLEKKYIKIIFKDTGKGIEKDLLDRIFDPLFTTKSESKGSGLGLSNVYNTIHNYNGAIGVESEVGVGTSFTIIFPVA